MQAVRLNALALALMVPFVGAPASSVAAGGDTQISVRQWQADIDYLAERAQVIHPKLFHAMTPAQWRAALDAAKRTTPGTRDEEIVALMRLVATIQDGHNEVEFPCGLGSATNFPLRLAWFPQGVLVEAAARPYASLVGGVVEAIDDTPIDRAWALLEPLVSHDAGNPESGLRAHPSIYLTCSGLLHGLGITHVDERAVFAIRLGRSTVRATLRPTSSWLDVVAPPTLAVPDGFVEVKPSSAPLWSLHPSDAFWYAYLPAARALYVQIDAIVDGPRETLAAFSTRLADAVRTDAPEKLIVDLRRNSGGDNTLLRPLLITLIHSPQADRIGRFIVLTSPETFSAGTNLANRLESSTSAIFIGRPTGDNVNFYADARSIVLPGSGIDVHIAQLYWQDGDPRDHRAALYPDVAVDPSLDDVLRGRDRTLETALAYTPEETLEDRLRVGAAAGFDAAYADYRAFLADPKHEYVHLLEPRLNALGYQLLAEKHEGAAVTIFRINTREHPDSTNAWDSLGDGYASAGLLGDAAASYRRSLELDGANQDAARSLRKIATPPTPVARPSGRLIPATPLR